MFRVVSTKNSFTDRGELNKSKSNFHKSLAIEENGAWVKRSCP